MPRNLTAILLAICTWITSNQQLCTYADTLPAHKIVPHDQIGHMVVHNQMPCSANELACPDYQICLSYEDEGCLTGGICLSHCFSGHITSNCPKDTCQGDHLCLKLLSYTDGSATKCYCPAGKLQLANGTCADLVKCEGAYKDRYCDQQCTGNAVCSCGEGFALQNQTGKYGDYGACVPDGGYGEVSIILNGVSSSEWQLPSDNFVTLNTDTAISRVLIRSSLHKIQQIFSVTLNQNKFELTHYKDNGQMEGHQPIIYNSPGLVDFAMDWPIGVVYYLSKTEPKLVACNSGGEYCRMLETSPDLINPAEIVIDARLKYIIVADDFSICRMRLDGSKLLRLELPGLPTKLTLDYENHYLHYISSHDNSVYRIDYQHFDSRTRPQKLFSLSKIVGEITSMAAIGRKLYISEYMRNSNTSVLYHNLTTNPFQEQKPVVLARGPGRLKSVFLYHKSLVTPGTPLTADSQHGHLVLQGTPTCMEGFKMDPDSKNCSQILFNDFKDFKGSILLYTSKSKQLILGMTVSDSISCPYTGLGTIPINPIPLLGGSPQLDVHLGYDVKFGYLYYSDDTVIRKAPLQGIYNRSEDTDWRATVGHKIYGIAINPSLRMIYYAEYSLIDYYILASSLDRPSIQAKYESSPLAGQRYFSSELMESNYELRVVSQRDGVPVAHGISMLHARSVDPATGVVYNWKPGTGYQYLEPEAKIDSLEEPVYLKDALLALTMGDNGVLHFVSSAKEYGVANVSDPTSNIVCPNISLSTVWYIRPSIDLFDVPEECSNCSGLCLLLTSGNFSCQCTTSDSSDSHCQVTSDTGCVGNQHVCPGDIGQCIDQSQLCDDVEDCPNGEDEHFSTYCPLKEPGCATIEVKCNGSAIIHCIRPSQLCDGTFDCGDGEDETHCSSAVNPTCPQFKCPQSGRCYGLEARCDGISDCPEYSTEQYTCTECQLSAFKCPDDTCIPNFRLCDGVLDCYDGSDEEDCASEGAGNTTNCELDMKQCKSGQCIPDWWWCDNTRDCVDNSDEESCDAFSCPIDYVKCNNTGQCIPSSWKCDTHWDCEDGEDERQCNITCPSSKFTCSNSGTTTCISWDMVCDGVEQCENGADEGVGCAGPYCADHACSHDCHVSPAGGYKCTCPDNMQLDLDEKTCLLKRTDCQKWGICSQKCTDLVQNQVKCSCNTGYTIQPDQYTCRHDDGTPSLIFSNRHDLKFLPTEPGEVYTVIQSGLRNTIAVDFHYEKKYIFWSDIIMDTIYRGTMDPESSTGALTDVIEVITSGLPTAEGLAVDWIGNHIYWVESVLDIIEVADLDGSNRATIISHGARNPIENPRSIAVDPRVGLLFWADWGIRQLRRATMAGEEQHMLFSVNHEKHIPDGAWANGLTLDYDMKRVYWNDAKSHSIQSVNYDGQDFRLILYNNHLLQHPFSISVFENWVYWSDWKTNSINRANKWNGTNAQTVHGTVTQPFDLKVFHVGRQPGLSSEVEAMCSARGCSHLCLRNSETSVRCACPHLLELSHDNKTCQDISKFLLIATPSFVTSITPELSISHGVMPTLAPPTIEKVYMLDYYIVAGKPKEHRIFWADEGLQVIATSSIKGADPTNIMDLAQGVEFSLAVDYIHERLYIGTYTLKHSQLGAIDVCDFSGTRRSTIATGFGRPKTIVLLPSNGTMYVGDEGDQAIYSMFMDGSFMSGEKSSSNILNLNKSISLSNKIQMALSSDDSTQSVLYFGDSSQIYKFDGSAIEEVMTNQELGTWSVRDDQLFTSSKFTNIATRGFDVNLWQLSNISNSTVIGALKGNFPTDMKIVETSRTVAESDKVTCSSCNHHCLPKGPSTAGEGTCVCYTGYSYQDGSCQAIFPLLLYSTRRPGAMLYGVELSNISLGKNSLVPIPRVNNIVSVAYHRQPSTSSEPDYIYWIDSDSGTRISRSTRDLTDRQTIVSNLVSAFSLVIDSAAGNLYWADVVAGTIEVCKTDGSQRMLIHQINASQHNQLLSIALHPSKGKLFFLESAFGVSVMTPGKSNPAVIYRDSGGIVNIAVDVTHNRLFVCTGNQQIVYMSIDDFIPHNISLDSPYHCSSIAVFGNKIAYSYTNKIWLRDIESNYVSPPVSTRASVTDLAFANKDLHDFIGDNPCAEDNGGCEGLCLFNGDPSAGSHCACAMGVLDADGKSCADLKDFLVYSKVTAIEYHNIGVNSTNPNAPSPYPKLSNNKTLNVIALATDTDRQRIYFSDIQRRAISWASYDGKQTADIITNVGSVEGLAYDRNLLYFTYQSSSDSNLPAIKYVNLNLKADDPGRLKLVVELSRLDAPRAIAVHSCSGYIFWSNWNEGSPSIQRAETSGAKFTSIITTDIVIPNGLAIDHKMEKIFWADASLDKIEMCGFLGQDRKIIHQQVSPHIFAMAIHGDYLYWTDWMQRSVRRAYKLSGSLNQTLVTKVPQQLMGIAIASNITCHASPCYSSPCQQTCTVLGNGESYTCGCFEGYIADPLNSSLCLLNAQGCKEEFLCHGDCIPWELTCDGVNHCIPKSENTFPADEDPYFCATRICPEPKFFTCRNQRCIHANKTCDKRDDCGDLSDEFDCKYEITACDNETEFLCSDKQRCIPLVNLCDRIPQCWDKSDELPPHCNSSQSSFVDCSVFEHPFYGEYRNGVKCEHTPVCILEEWKCDGHNDCWDNSDEADCEKVTTCSSDTEFECQGEDLTGIKCIQRAWICDGEMDCLDGSDEVMCGPVTCPVSDFTCSYGECIPLKWKCDSEVDCHDGSDEADCTERVPAHNCSDAEFECLDKKFCVNKDYMCDGEMDCVDGSDESSQLGCQHSDCPDNEFLCGNGLCVPRHFLCDRTNDCLDNSDEPNTCVYTSCDLETQFVCKNGDCIPMASHCDGWPDCVDGSDEGVATCPPRLPNECPKGQWKCPYGGCLNETKLCDGFLDCNLIDEVGCFLNECHEGNGGCNQLCIDEKIGFHCGCYLPGFTMSSDNRTCVDVNECVEQFPCSQTCVNEHGSYFCRCAPGYQLRDDKRTCRAIKGADGYLLVANRYYIRKLSLQIDSNVNRSVQSLLAHNLLNAVGLDYDWLEQKIYWTDVTTEQQKISRMDFNGENMEVLHSVTTKHPDGLAVDWIGRNIYWSDNVLNTIEVSRLDSRHRKVLLRGISEPRSLQLHPAKGYLFYTDWGQGAHIGRANMDGTSQKRIIEDNVGWPNALAVDTYADRLFFGDAKLNYIAMTDLEGQNKRMILSTGVNHIFSLAVFEDSLYWSDWGQKKVYRVDKLTGSFVETLTSSLIHRPMELRVVHELNQATKGDNPCDKLNCHGLCLFKPFKTGVQATCACPEEYTLAADGRTCLSNCNALSRFECFEGTQCLHITQKCDGHLDCWDGSDEKYCIGKSQCGKPFQFHCQPGADSVCVDAEKMCDGQFDCPQGYDEKVFDMCRLYDCMNGLIKCSNATAHMCLSPDQVCKLEIASLDCPGFNYTLCETSQATCASSEFRCKDSSCIPYVYRCDDEPDCADSSDEDDLLCNSDDGCNDGYVSCNQTNQCIPTSWLCDGDDDCKQGQDETPELCDQVSCLPSYFQCNDKKCIPQRWRCDYENDCIDGSDEIGCEPRECSASEVKCANGLKCIHSSQKCDGFADCSDGSDEFNCKDSTACKEDEFRCISTGRCIPSTWQCDRTVDCLDHSDETDCAARACAPGEFKCQNNLCIPETFKCDGQNDCVDNSDEVNAFCDISPCLPGRFRCGNNICVPKTLLCDGHDDCGDNSDESSFNCESGCGAGMFTCPNTGQCIDESKVCDGEIDCLGERGSRECSTEEECAIAYSNDEHNADFVCRRAVGGCTNVHANLFFIRTYHTAKSFKQLCVTAFKCENVKRSLVKITCEKGYEIDITNALDHCRVCQDRDECLDYGKCSQICQNTAGSYKCSCQKGFSLLKDNRPGPKHDCVLDSEEEAPYLLIADGHALRSFDLYKTSSASLDDRPSFISVVEPSSRIDSVTADMTGEQWTAYMLSYHSNVILKTDITSLRTNYRKRRSSPNSIPQQSTAIKSQTRSVAEVIKSNLTNTKSIAYDWVHGNLYWVDSEHATISLMHVARKLESTIVTEMSMMAAISDRHINPQHITIDPIIVNRIFWTDCCVKPRIWSADLDGSNPEMLADELEWPGGIVCDVSNGRLYWTDGKHRTISTMTVTGTDRRTIYRFTSGMQPNMIDVFGRELIVTSLDRKSVVTLDKFVGVENSTHQTNISTVVNSTAMHVGDIIIVHPVKLYQPAREWNCDCGPNSIITETFHEGHYRCSCLCADDYMKVNTTHCQYCPCLNTGICSNQPDQPIKCICPKGYGGVLCEQHLCKDYCGQKAECEVFDGAPFCKCSPGYAGERCNQHACSSDLCLNNGTCHLDNGGLSYCVCPMMYTGERCQTRMTDLCKERGCVGERAVSCTSDPATQLYDCQCAKGYAGFDCENCLPEDNRLYTCHSQGKCSYSSGKPLCTCNSLQFEHITQCHNSVCYGYCSNGGTCFLKETSGGRKEPTCACSKYFTGKHCQIRMKCVTGYCHNGGTCIENDNGKPASCLCNKDFTGELCDEGCKEQPCLYGKTCQKPVSFFLFPECTCPEGLRGEQCEFNSLCDSHCHGHGICVGCLASVNATCSTCCECNCYYGWTGETCETKIHEDEQEASSNPPQHSKFTAGIIAAVASVSILLVLLVVVIILVVYKKRQKRRVLFEHLRLSEERDGTMEISNPMYLKSTNEDDDEDDDDYSVYSATNTSNFANPLFSSRSGRKQNKKPDERVLLIDNEQGDEDL